MKRYEVIEHTADAGIVAHGRDPGEAFANAARGMFSLVADPPRGRTDFHHDVDLSAPDRETLLVDWLNELIFIFEVEHVILSRFEILDIGDNQLRARVRGYRIDPARHRLKSAVKAATYHSLRVEEEDGVSIRVIFDM